MILMMLVEVMAEDVFAAVVQAKTIVNADSMALTLVVEMRVNV